MTRHILDRKHSESESRLKRYTELERDGKPHPASRALHQRKRDEDAPRLAIYTKIDRTKEE